MKKSMLFCLALAATAASLMTLAAPVKSRLASAETDYIAALDPLPYDAIAVEYIESSGTQYLNVGPIIDADEVVVYCAATELPTTGNRKAFSIGWNANLRDDFGIDSTCWEGQSSWLVELGVSVVAKFNLEGIFVNGIKRGGFPSTYFFNAVNAGKSLFLFCGSNGSTAYITTGGNYQAWRGTISLVSVSSKGNLLRYLIPVRFPNELGEWEGAMYDFVSGELFRNQGTGSFVIGPDL